MSTLARNTLFLTAASIGQKAVAFLYFALIAKMLPVEGTGAYFLALALVTTIGVVDDIGLTSVMIREIARAPGEAKVWIRNALGAKLITMPVTVALAFVLPGMLNFDVEAANLVRLAIFIMLADTLSLSFYGVLRGMQELRYESLGIFVGQAITTVLGVSFLAMGERSLTWLIIALISGSVWNLLFAGWNVVRRLGWGAIVPSFSLGSMPVKAAFAFFLSAVFVKLYSYVDSFTLNHVYGEWAVGIYSVAYKLTYAFQFLPLAFVGALYPTFAAQKDDKVMLRKIFLDAQWYMALLVTPIVFGVFALAPEIIDMFFTSEQADYSASAPVLSILIFVLVFIFADFPIGSLLNATGRQMQKTIIMGATMVINIIANFVLIPRVGVAGASIAGLISFSFMCIAGWLAARRVVALSVRDLFRLTGGLFLAGFLMAIVVMVAKTILPWVLTIPLGAAVFIALAFATKSFTVDHLRTFRGLLRRKYDQSPATNA